MSSIASAEGPEGRALLRPFRRGDEADLADICLRTGDGGADATGLYRSSGLLADIFVLPYVAKHPDAAFVIDDGQRVVGYVVCAPDTAAFERWFRYEWWPPREEGHRRAAGDSAKDAAMLRYAAAIGGGRCRSSTSIPRICTSTCCPKRRGAGGGAL
ncbi:hypothetical protein [Microbacterium sp. Se5.02b]|uniref:hypothetical protein n=1 Tax=Microbacterium sp. Se5.02b TaxID=2864103 RepID=UPI00215D9C67|nr:hypothetical protein [Microbacterium sp. Se5.02b]